LCFAPTWRNQTTRVGCKRKIVGRRYLVHARTKKKGKKVISGVGIREVNMRKNNGNLLILKSSQSKMVGKRKMVDEEQLSNKIST
jgi:hypothetical protein